MQKVQWCMMPETSPSRKREGKEQQGGGTASAKAETLRNILQQNQRKRF